MSHLEYLKKQLIAIEEYDNRINNYIDAGKTNACACCIEYFNALLDTNKDIKVLCLTKIKKQEQVCSRSITELENMLLKKIDTKLGVIKEKAKIGKSGYDKRMKEWCMLFDMTMMLMVVPLEKEEENVEAK